MVNIASHNNNILTYDGSVVTYTPLVLDGSLQAYYQFNGTLGDSTNFVRDLSILDHDYSYQSGVSGVSGDTALYMDDDTTGFQAIRTDSTLCDYFDGSIGKDWTITFWYKGGYATAAIDNFYPWRITTDDTSKSEYIRVVIRRLNGYGSIGSISFRVWTGTGSGNAYISNAIIIDGDWHLYSFRKNGTTYSMDIDVSVASDDFTWSAVAESLDSLRVGVLDTASNVPAYIDNLRLYNKHLSDVELTQIYDNKI